MLTFKKYGAVLVGCCLLMGCMESRYNFDVRDTLEKRAAQFLGNLPGVGRVPYLGPVVAGAKTVDVYRATFKEVSIEKDNLLEFTGMNDSSTIARASYNTMSGYMQELYLLNYQFTYDAGGEVPASAVVFVSLRYRPTRDEAATSLYECTGPGPLYWGVASDGHLSFDSVLRIRPVAGGHRLSVEKQRKGSNFNLLFMPDGPLLGKPFSIVKIVRMERNRIGGEKPLVFDIPAIFGDKKAMHFDFVQTINLQ